MPLEQQSVSRRRLLRSCAAVAAVAAAPRGVGADTATSAHSVRLRAGDLTAVIGDNSAEGAHRAGYNGVWDLTHAAADRSLFVPTLAGLNLEHVVTGAPLRDDAVFFEPRRAPMTLRRLSDSSCQLHQPPTPVTHVESTTTFELRQGGILDMQFECRPHRAVFPHGYLSLFWASYVNAPEDRSMYFLGGRDGHPEGWCQLCTQFHNDQSTVRHRDDHFDAAYEADGRAALFRNFSPLRFDQPFFYGIFADLIWLVMFDRTKGIRLTHSPSGGGGDAKRRTTNPAWDFQFMVRGPEVGRMYGFSVRTVLRPRCGRDELLDLVRGWQSERGARADADDR